MWEWLRRVLGASNELKVAAKEISDLPPLIDNYRGVVRGFESLQEEARNAWADHAITPAEAQRLFGRLKDLAISYKSVDKELTEAIDATQVAVNKVLG